MASNGDVPSTPSEPENRIHYIWDHELNTGICWCGEDHADDSGNHGPIPEDQWIPADDPRVPELLDGMYLEAWLAWCGGDPKGHA